MNRTWGFAFAALVGFSSLVGADDKPRSGEREEAYSDAMFVKKAAIGGHCEVLMGKLAQTNAQSPEVKKFAEQMVADHTKANEKLMALAKAVGVEAPTAIPDEKQKELEKMQGLRGAEFDREYMTHQVKAHEMAVKYFTMAGEKAQNNSVKEFATQTLPTLKEHYEMAKKLHGTTAGAGGQ